MSMDAEDTRMFMSQRFAKERQGLVAEIELLSALLYRALAAAETGHWRDKAGLSLEALPLWDDARAALEEQLTAPCPGGGYTGQPHDEAPTVENCLRAGVCGCDMGAALEGKDAS